MFKSILLITILATLASCASEKPTFYSDYSHTCYQQKDPTDPVVWECARFDNERDLYKWHKVKPWQELGDMPELP